MQQQVEAVLGLFVAVAFLATLAQKIGVAYPILLVFGGLIIGLVPGLPAVEVNPDAIFLLLVPPLVYAAAVTTPWRDFRLNLRPILFLAVGLVLVTLVAVGAIAHYAIDGYSWASALVLGAIVSASDAVSVSAVTERLRVPRRAVIILDGESLANDTTALIAYRMAVAAVVTGFFSWKDACLGFIWAAFAGMIIGLGVARVMIWLRRHLRHPPVEITLSLVTPFAAYLPAEAVHASGVLAVAAAGLYIGRHGLALVRAETRVHGFAFWEMLVFLLNGLAFILIGLELREVFGQLGSASVPRLIADAALVSGITIGIRLVWVFPASYLPRLLSRKLRAVDPVPPWQQLVLVGWGGMRGIDSLVTALGLPRIVSGGAPFPQRSLTLFLAYGVIFATLVVQGLTLPFLIRLLGLRGGEEEEREEAEARLAAARAALTRLNQLSSQGNVPPETLTWLRGLQERRVRRYEAQHGRNGRPRDPDAAARRRVRREVLRAERQAVIALRDREVISDDVLRRVEEDLDLEELLLED